MNNELCIYACPTCNNINPQITVNKSVSFQIMQVNQTSSNCSKGQTVNSTV